jgi:hypothetical protein
MGNDPACCRSPLKQFHKAQPSPRGVSKVSFKSAFLVRWRDHSPQQVFAELSIPFAYTAMAELGITAVQLRNITKALKFFGFPGAEVMHPRHRKKAADVWDDICPSKYGAHW